MALSRTTATGDGSTITYSLNFTLGYIRESDVTCQVGGEVDGLGDPVYRTLTFLSPGLVTVGGDVPGVGEEIVFERTVPKDTMQNDFQDLAILDEENLDNSFLQIMHAVHEFLDGRGLVITEDLDVNSNKIINVATPADDGDATNKAYVDSVSGAASANAAAASAVTAASSAAAATTKASEASDSADAAAASAASVPDIPASTTGTAGQILRVSSDTSEYELDDGADFAPGPGDIGTTELADDSVTAAKVADGAIDSRSKAGSNVLGKVLQVAQTAKTDTESVAGATSWTDVTGLSVSITPTSASSKILVEVVLSGSSPTDIAALRVERGGSAIVEGDAAGSRTRAASLIEQGPGNTMSTTCFKYLDSPASTSEQTYAVQVISPLSQTIQINRTLNDADSSGIFRAVSTITVTEIAA